MIKKRLDEILQAHARWLKDPNSGNRANLSGANLSGADLSGANLSGANLDYSAWPLWCGSLGVKIDERIGRQLLYHALSACAPWICPTKKQLDWANGFHRVGEAPKLKLKVKGRR